MEKLTRSEPICEGCNEHMSFTDSVPSNKGPISIYKCRKCGKLYWQEPKQEPNK